MASDPTIYAQLGKGVAPAQSANPLDTLGRVAQTGNALIAGRSAQMQLAGRMALAKAYQGVAIDPKTGLPDSNQLIANLQQTPGGALVLPQVIQGLQEQQKRQFDLNKAQQDQITSRTNTVNNALGPLMRMGSNVGTQDILGTIAGLHASGFPTDELVADAATTLPVKTPGMSNAQYGQQLQGWVMNHAARTWDPATQAKMFTPNPTQVNNGGTISFQDTNALTNPGIVGSSIGMQMSPAEQTDQVKGPMGSNGQQTVIPRATYAGQNGLGYLVPGGSGTAGPPQPSPLGNGRPGGIIPPSLLNPNRAAPTPVVPVPAAPGSIGAGSPGYAPAIPASASAGGSQQPAPYQNAPLPVQPSQFTPTTGYSAPAISQPGAPMPVSMGPAQTSALAAQGTQGQDAAGALSALAQDSPARQAQISAMLGDLTKYGSGPNSPLWQSARGRLVQMGMAPSDWTEGVAAQENFTKMANQFLAKQASGMGPVTNDKLALAAESGPNPLFTTLGNQGVLHIAQGNEDALNVKNQAWTQATLPPAQGGQGLTGADYQNWSTQFNQGFSPSAFWYARMAPQERQTLVSGMAPDQQAQLHGSIVDGIDKGWISPALLTQPAAGTAPASSAPASVPSSAPASAPGGSIPPAAAPAALPLTMNGYGQPAIAGGY